MSKVLSVRVDDELAAWADEYAESRGVTRQALLAEGLRNFREDCLSGVPEIREMAKRQSSVRTDRGVGDCPEREEDLGHVWASPRTDPLRSCVYCGAHGREPARGFDGKDPKPDQGGGHFVEATMERTELHDGVRVPMQSGTGDPRKAWPQGMPDEMATRAARIVAEKKERDREARESGVGRPGQLRGKS